MKHLLLCLLFSCATQLPAEIEPEQPTPKQSPQRSIAALLASTDKDSPEYPDLLMRRCQSFDQAALRALRASLSLEESRYQRKTDDLDAQIHELNESRDKENANAIECYRELSSQYPTYSRRDEALFSLGYLLQNKDAIAAKLAYQSLVEGYPSSQYLGSALLSLAKDAFDSSDVMSALTLFHRAETSPQISEQEHGYAVYMQGWCLLNLSRFEESLDAFSRVVLASHGARNAVTLEREARLEVTMVYLRTTRTPKDAEAFFGSLGDATKVPSMLKDLAEQYYQEGKFSEFKDTCKLYLTKYEAMREVCAQPTF